MSDPEPFFSPTWFSLRLAQGVRGVPCAFQEPYLIDQCPVSSEDVTGCLDYGPHYLSSQKIYGRLPLVVFEMSFWTTLYWHRGFPRYSTVMVNSPQSTVHSPHSHSHSTHSIFSAHTQFFWADSHFFRPHSQYPFTLSASIFSGLT